MKKSDRDIVEILEVYDTTGITHSAAQLAVRPRSRVATRPPNPGPTQGPTLRE
jgi:hypothetical protein